MTTSSLLAFARGPGRIGPWARLARLGGATPGAPLVIYVGGAVGRDEYQARRATEPTPIADQLARALLAEPLPRLDLLVCPCPVDTGGEGLEWIVQHHDDELMPALGAPPSALACLGFSAGAAYALHLAIVADAVAVALFGASTGGGLGADDRRLVDARVRAGKPDLAMAVFRNHDDPVAATERLVQRLPSGLHARAMAARPGGHAFRDYAANATVSDAFAFVLRHLRDAGAGPGSPVDHGR